MINIFVLKYCVSDQTSRFSASAIWSNLHFINLTYLKHMNMYINFIKKDNYILNGLLTILKSEDCDTKA